MAVLGFEFIQLAEVVAVLIVLAVLLSGLKVINEWERIPVLRLGRYVGLRGPGIIYLIPFIDKAPVRVSTRLQTVSFRTEQTLTSDNVPVNVDAVMYDKPVDCEKVFLNVESYTDATNWAAQTTLREVIGKVDLNELLAERDKVGQNLRAIIDEKTEAWGIKVTSVEVKDVVIPRELQDAMSKQAQAERERMARVTLATAELQSAQKMIEAAKMYEDSAGGLTLRWMNILYEIGQQQGTNTLMIIPANIPIAGASPIGLFTPPALKKKAEAQEQQKPRS
ncbi:SPFH domain-containing protein [Candidatus Bathyarchaeota archaeon]|jgi:regulator of protease activity HflC (stomatin/prohibitin superfamily)|nr:SPFH domain-containing protein [Candidatus Bathyarchaeota archaeon]